MQAFRKYFLRPWSASLMAMTLALGGCASTGSNMVGEGQLDPRLTEGSDAKFFSQSGFESCAMAAAGGVAVCLLAAPSNKKAMCAVAAGVAMCGIAMGTNYYLDYRRSQYKTTGATLDAVTKDVEEDTRKLQQRSQTLQAVIDTDQRKLAQLRDDVAQGRMQQADARAKLRDIDRDMARIKLEQDNIDSKIASYRELAASKDLAGTDIKKLDMQIEKLQGEATRLSSAMGTLTTQRNSLDWGKAA
ncbi:hypothetical protein [Achromobacter aloeverae]